MLEVTHLLRKFGDKVAVNDVSFAVHPGALTGFVGSNGAGKTTTMRMIMGVLATHGGEIQLNGRPVTAEDRRRFGYMPEERGLYPKQRILDQLIYLARLRGMSKSRAKSRAGDLLDVFDLGDRALHSLESLSLGNQQRVQIAAAVITQPDVLILDEPFSGLDPTATDAMAELLGEYAADGVPILFSSHQLDLVERLCERLIILAGGRVVAEGTATELTATDSPRYRLVLGEDAEWLHAFTGIRIIEIHGPTAELELSGATTNELLSAAVKVGPVYEFAPIRASVSDVYREVIG
jgi:ABC-2 type transport system ATP-binding protein